MQRGDVDALRCGAPAPAARADALHFLGVLREAKMPFGGFLVNRCVAAPEFAGTGVLPGAPTEADAAAWATMCAAIREAPERRRGLVRTQDAAIAELRRALDAPAWCIPDLERDVHDLHGLEMLVPHLPGVGDL